MKITAIKTFLMHAGSPQLKSWAADGSFGTQVFSGNLTGTRNWLFVKVYTDEGVVGIGECSGWPRVIETAVQDLKALLIGEDPQHGTSKAKYWACRCGASWAARCAARYACTRTPAHPKPRWHSKHAA